MKINEYPEASSIFGNDMFPLETDANGTNKLSYNSLFYSVYDRIASQEDVEVYDDPPIYITKMGRLCIMQVDTTLSSSEVWNYQLGATIPDKYRPITESRGLITVSDRWWDKVSTGQLWCTVEGNVLVSYKSLGGNTIDSGFGTLTYFTKPADILSYITENHGNGSIDLAKQLLGLTPEIVNVSWASGYENVGKVLKYGNIVSVLIRSGQLPELDYWGDTVLASGLPIYKSYNDSTNIDPCGNIVTQDSNHSTAILRVDSTGDLHIEGKNQKFPGGWSFGSMSYICE